MIGSLALALTAFFEGIFGIQKHYEYRHSTLALSPTTRKTVLDTWRWALNKSPTQRV
jgi:hypothetical protein